LPNLIKRSFTFVGISSYMLFVGLYYSAISISLNSELRKSIKKSVDKEFSFVSRIGLSQMEHEIQTRVKTITKRSAKTLEENSGVQVPLESEEVDAYIKLVIKEKEKNVKQR
jgi:ribosomal protein RSM22 (predicted rRNA methylase)